MRTWEKGEIVLDDGARAQAQMPVIVSASRSTDIPAFYADWFIRRFRGGDGYVRWTNPFSGKPLYVSFQKTRLIVFWSKNPSPMMRVLPDVGKTPLDIIEASGRNYYFQYTMNDYDLEGVEPCVPRLPARIDTLKRLAERIGDQGPDRVIWRFDPLILTDAITPEMLLERIARIGDEVKGYTRRLVFSFVDINAYARVAKNLERGGIRAREFSVEEMRHTAVEIARMAHSWGMTAATCGEMADLPVPDGVPPIDRNRCVDDRLMARCFNNDRELMRLIGAHYVQPDLLDKSDGHWKTEYHKDPGQRDSCGCVMSKDIGEYNTCPHLCHYCYANTSNETAARNWQRHRDSPNSETITGL